MQSLLRRFPPSSPATFFRFRNFPSSLNYALSTTTIPTSSSSDGNADGEWNDAWESAWLPDHLSPGTNSSAPWETDANFSSPSVVLPSDVDAETKAFVHDMDENWDVRKAAARGKNSVRQTEENTSSRTEQKENQTAMDYRLKKQRIHASLWMREIEKVEEARLDDCLGGVQGGQENDIEKLLHSCSQFFDSSNTEFINPEISSSSEFKNMPDGWETTSKTQDGNPWEMSQREEDILLQEFERRIAFSKFQIASFIKSHIFSRRRPIDGWKYMIEELGPNARKGKGSVQRLPAVSDEATQPFTEERQAPPLARRLPAKRNSRVLYAQ